jgi:hypothetical protein
VPLPTTEVAIRLEIECVLDAYRNGYSEVMDFSMLAKEARVMNALYYSDRYSSDDEFWKCIHRVNAYSADAYITVSAFIAVVVEPQKPAVSDYLYPLNYAIAAMENYVMYTRKSKRDDDVRMISLSKYVQRFIRCYRKVDEVKVLPSRSDSEVVDRIVKLRSQATAPDSVDMDMYKQVIDKLGRWADELVHKLSAWVAQSSNTHIYR